MQINPYILLKLGGVFMNSSCNLNKFEGRIGYQVIIDRFCRSFRNVVDIPGRKIKEWSDSVPEWKADTDGIYRNRYFYKGDLQGLIRKLDYIKELGIGLLILGPISKTEEYHHYDVGDQRIIDPYIGTEQDFRELCKEAHKRDILIGVDLIFNHMGYNSEIFQKALHGDVRYRRWFFFNPDGTYRYWYDFKNMPLCNQLNPDFQSYACDVAVSYVKNGADMLRFDLGEILEGELVDKIDKAVRKVNSDVLIVNERWEFANTQDNYAFYFDTANSVMNYPSSDAILRWIVYKNSAHFNYTMDRIKHYPMSIKHLQWNMLDTHDTPRAINMLYGEGMNSEPFDGRIWNIEGPWRKIDSFDTYGFRKWEAEHSYAQMPTIVKRKLILASLIQYLIPGIPVIFYGTEVGMQGLKDPFNRGPYPWDKEDLELRKQYIELGKMKNQNRDVFARGDWKWEVNPNTLKIERSSECGTIIAIVNISLYEIQTYANVPNEKAILAIGESTTSKVAPLGAIVYRI